MTTTVPLGRAGARPLREALHGDLLWRRPGLFRRELQLEAGSEVLARLRWPRLFRFEAEAESADGRWIIGRQRRGSLRGQVVVRDAASRSVVATFTRGWRRKGAVRCESGREYRWDRSGFWRAEYSWSSAEKERLVAFRWRAGLTARCAMEVDPAALRLPELPVLVLLGAFVMAMLAAETAAHA